MAVLIPKKLIYLEHPRTGSTSVRTALSRMRGAMTKSRHTLYLPDRGEKVLSVVRNPFDALVSWWLATAGKWKDHPSFDHFVEHCNNPFFVKRGNLFYFAQYSDYVIKFENLERELNFVLKQVKLPTIKLQHLNTTKNKLDYHSYYTEKTKEIVERRFAAELRAFDYEW